MSCRVSLSSATRWALLNLNTVEGRHKPFCGPLYFSHRRVSASHSAPRRDLVIGLRREDSNRIWERRAALTPEDADYLLKTYPGLRILIQPCSKRVFPTESYLQIGAKAHPTLEPAHIILGIKEPPVDDIHIEPILSPNSSSNVARTYFMFSHTIKGQPYNMPLLSKFLKQSPNADDAKLLPTLIDYELLTNDIGQRNVGFGWYAGVAGLLEGFISTAQLYLEMGVALPFLRTPRPHTASVADLRAALRKIGEEIEHIGTPRSLGPFIIAVTGTGQVARGALSMLSELPVEILDISDLQQLVTDPNASLNKIYLLHATQDTYLVRKDGSPYKREDYYLDPSAYQSLFYKLVAPYVSMLVNGVGWSPVFPRLLTTDQTVMALRRVQELHKQLNTPNSASGVFERVHNENVEVMKGRCRSFVDISCDVKGGLEFLPHASTLSEPFYKYRPEEFPEDLPPLQIMSVDILPAALPLDASGSFSKGILPYLENVIARYLGQRVDTDDSINRSVDRAIVVREGTLVDKHAWLQDGVKIHRSSHTSLHEKYMPPRRKKVLLLGSGLVAGPTVDELCKRSDIDVIVASDDISSIQALIKPFANASGLVVSLRDNVDKIRSLIKESDIVISLLPALLHAPIAEICIEHRKNLVTASYISLAMRALHEKAINAHVLLLNEIGLDPGIDHCSALALLSSLHDHKLKPVSFISFCGGLPAPECADVPLGYKFSWSPEGVLKAAMNSAKFRLKSKNFMIPSVDLLTAKFDRVPVSRILNLEGIANRDSLQYADSYDLGSITGMRTVLRGTLRYPGYCEVVSSLRRIGLLEEASTVLPKSWPDLARQSLGLRLGIAIPDEASFKSALADVLSPASYHSALEALSQLGLVDTKLGSDSSPGPPSKPLSPLVLLAQLLSQKLQYKPHERDLVILHHEVATRPSASLSAREELHISTLEVYGNEKASAMSRCVGLPVAFAALKMLDGDVTIKGVHGPTDPAIYHHILDSLETAGIHMKYKSISADMALGIEQSLRKDWFAPNERYSVAERTENETIR